MPDQFHFLVDGNGEIPVKHLLRFENILPEFNARAADLKLDRGALPQKNRIKVAKKGSLESDDAVTLT